MCNLEENFSKTVLSFGKMLFDPLVNEIWSVSLKVQSNTYNNFQFQAKEQMFEPNLASIKKDKEKKGAKRKIKKSQVIIILIFILLHITYIKISSWIFYT